MCKDCTDISRRRLLRLGASGLLTAGLASTGLITPSFAKTAVTPDEALEQLIAGNQKFVAAPELCEIDMLANRAEVAKGQSPWATVLTCSDSRVGPELVFGGLNLGQLFVCRNAGNMADTATLGSIEYAAEHLGSPLIVVMGHQRCGAVAAACEEAEKGTKFPGSIGPMVEAILPAAQAEMGKPGDFVDNVVHASAKRTVELILSKSSIVAEMVEAGHIKIVPACYELDTGNVEFMV